jgi:hypothetical protein
MPMAKTKTLNLPPFPPLNWDSPFWDGKLKLPSWVGFRTSRRRRPSDGTVCVNVTAQDADDETPPTQGQVQAFQHLLDNEATVAATVLQALFECYPDDKDAYEEFREGATLPDIDDPAGMREVIRLANVHVLNVFKGGAAYIGFELACAWDEEHGAGVMTHRGRVVEVGQADTSFLEWIAEDDAKKRKRKS